MRIRIHNTGCMRKIWGKDGWAQHNQEAISISYQGKLGGENIAQESDVRRRVGTSVVERGCLSRIPDPIFFHP